MRINVDTVKRVLSVDAPWMDELFTATLGSYNETEKDIEFDHFIEFLESGQYIPVKETWKDSSSVPAAKPHALRSHALKKNRPPPVAVNIGYTKSDPPTPPGHTSGIKHFGDKENSRNASSFGGIVEEGSLSSEGSSRVRDALADNKSANGSGKSDDNTTISMNSSALVRSGGNAIAPLNMHRQAGPTKAMWRKSEVVEQKRTVSYTTIDAEGQTQQLTETEMTQTEVLHMECRETGEFAHRETTKYEQLETFNSEVVAQEHGREEYVHLKSKDDEYEFMDSNMPQRSAPQPEQMDGHPQSPRVAAGEPHIPGQDQNQRGREEEGNGEQLDTGDDLSMKGSVSPMNPISPQAFPIDTETDNDPYVYGDGIGHGTHHDDHTLGVNGTMFFNGGSAVDVDGQETGQSMRTGEGLGNNGDKRIPTGYESYAELNLSEEEIAAVYAEAESQAAAELAALEREEALLAQEEAEYEAALRARLAREQSQSDAAAAAADDFEREIAVEEQEEEHKNIPEPERDFADID